MPWFLAPQSALWQARRIWYRHRERQLEGAGKPVAGALMTATWRAVRTTSTGTGTTNAAGVAQCTRKIARSTPGYPVKITVTFTQAGKAQGSAVTSFTPR